MRDAKLIGTDGLSDEFSYTLWLFFVIIFGLYFVNTLIPEFFMNILNSMLLTFIFKISDVSNVDNYRPISILSHIKKFEIIVLSIVY